MDTEVILCVTASAFLLLYGGNVITISFTNKCPYTVWPATLNAASSPALSTTGFDLATGESRSVDVPSPWSGRFWARTGCTGLAGRFKCATADCGSGQVECDGNGGAAPVTLAEITVAPSGGPDYYDISNVDGFNLAKSMAAQGGTGDCKESSCKANINAQCSNDLKVSGSDGSVIACESACEAFGNPEYCCSGDYNDPNKCKPSTYSQFFSNQCPQAYSYAYDDLKGTLTCNGGPIYAWNAFSCLSKR